MKTGSTNKRIRELISMVRDGRLLPRPEFQRRLVWSRNDKNLFLDTILRGYPFPEIYLADGEVDVDTGEGTQLLVDGQQRVNTIIQYFSGDPELKLTLMPPYEALDEITKKEFLLYEVAVRDLGAVAKDEIIEVFKRINATKYALHDMEISNAVYGGALKKFIEKFAERDFFRAHSVFSPSDYKRMGDMRFVLSIVTTYIGGYFNRDDAFEEMLCRYNDDFYIEEAIEQRLNAVIEFIEECGFSDKERVWKKADLYTLFVELDFLFNSSGLIRLQPSETVSRLSSFYADVDRSGIDKHPVVTTYYKAALQASNDKLNRVRRGMIIDMILRGCPYDEIYEILVREGLV